MVRVKGLTDRPQILIRCFTCSWQAVDLRYNTMHVQTDVSKVLRVIIEIRTGPG